MEHIKNAWNWKPGEKLRRSAGFTALRILAGFLSLMILCTLVSRAADSVTVPVVTTESPERGSIVHRLYLSGMLETSGGVAVHAPAGASVTDVLVAVGDTVAEGDLLFTFDTEASAREIEAKRLTIRGIEAELAVLGEQAARQSEQDRTARGRADEDYLATEEAQELIIAQRERAVIDAKHALREYDEDAWVEDVAGADAEHDRLLGAAQEAEIALEQALIAKEEALRRAERSIEDLAKEDSPDSTVVLKTLELQREQLALSTLLEAVENEGNVTAPSAGIVSALAVKVGGLTTGEAAAVVTDASSLRFVAEIGETEKEYVEAGLEAELSLSGEQRVHDGLTVASVAPIADQPDSFRVTADVPAEFGSPGRSGELMVARRSKQYDACIPLSALYGVQDDYYVFGIREGESVLGVEYYAEEIPVALLEKNGTTAAISGPFGMDARIITASPKPVRDGDRVRLGNPAL